MYFKHVENKMYIGTGRQIEIKRIDTRIMPVSCRVQDSLFYRVYCKFLLSGCIRDLLIL